MWRSKSLSLASILSRTASLLWRRMKNKWGDSKKVTVTRLAEVEVTKSMAAAVEVEDEDGGGERESESESESVPDMVAIGADTKHFRAAERGAFSLFNSLLFMHTSAPIYV
jgi:hypothetical protein